ncbi:MAG: DUF1843 domain-containing protein [Erythrobacter sp.]|nr:DUF1843 domain-containing protein [Erythrobacter sp.]
MTYVVLYGVGIQDAIDNPKTSPAELEKLLEHARSVLKQQGDLKAALSRLEEEISRREG